MEAQRTLRLPYASESELRRVTLATFRQREDGLWNMRADPVLRAARFTRIETAGHWAALAKLRCPTLLVRGADSYLVGRETAERMVATIPSCRLVEVADSAHCVPQDNPTGFIEVVRAFL